MTNTQTRHENDDVYQAVFSVTTEWKYIAKLFVVRDWCFRLNKQKKLMNIALYIATFVEGAIVGESL
jgi:hypothetical protein